MRHAFHPQARSEYLAAISFYEGARPGLGAAFTVEVESVVKLICQAPERWRKFEQEVRRCLTRRRFPSAVL